MNRDELVRWLDEYLQIHALPDVSLNGLQVEGNPEVTRVGAAVDASVKTFLDAADQGVDFLIVHHGLFWGQPQPVTGPLRRRLGLLFEHGINLYAAHLPLDAHPEVGNNAVLAELLGLTELAPFGSYQGHKIGYQGVFPTAQRLHDVADLMGQLTGMQALVHQGGPDLIKRVGVVSGSGAGLIPEAKAEGLDLLITGEPKHAAFHDAFEYGINVIYAGHYDTEVFGVKALAEKLLRTFGLPFVFLDHPTGL